MEPFAEGRAARGSVLVVDDEPLVASTFVRWVHARGWQALLATSVATATALLSEQLGGLILDVYLPDGSAFDIIEAAARFPELPPILVVTGAGDAQTVNRAQRLGCEYACKPDLRESVRAFLDRCARRPLGVDDVVAEIAKRHDLTPAQTVLVRAAIESSAHEAIAQKLDVTLNTVKKHIRGVLRKTHASSVEQLVSPLRSRLLRR